MNSPEMKSISVSQSSLTQTNRRDKNKFDLILITACLTTLLPSYRLHNSYKLYYHEIN